MTQQATQAVRSGRSALADLSSGIDVLQRENRGTTVRIKRLGERSTQISAMLATVSKMSAQTDMLALNASIEASRAGEEGQGFSLVAEEMRKLAEEASAAAREIERLVEGIQLDLAEAVGAMYRQAATLGVHAAATDAIVQALGKVGEASGAIEAATSGLGDEADGEVAALEALAGNFTTLDASTSALREAENSTRHAVEAIDELLGAFDGQWPSDGPCNARPSDGSRNDDI